MPGSYSRYCRLGITISDWITVFEDFLALYLGCSAWRSRDSVWGLLSAWVSYQRLPEVQRQPSYSQDGDRKPQDKFRDDISEFQVPTAFRAKWCWIVFWGSWKINMALITLRRSIQHGGLGSFQSVLIHHEPYFTLVACFLMMFGWIVSIFSKSLLSRNQLLQNWRP